MVRTLACHYRSYYQLKNQSTESRLPVKWWEATGGVHRSTADQRISGEASKIRGHKGHEGVQEVNGGRSPCHLVLLPAEEPEETMDNS